MKRIGMLGGTFDPPHLGHLLLAETALTGLELEQVLFLPVGAPTHKESQTPAAQRVRMTELALTGRPAFRLDTTDTDRPPPHYTVDLLPMVQQKFPTAELWLLIGGDSLRDLPAWYRPADVLDRCRVAVLPRPGAAIDWVDLALVFPRIRERVTRLRGPSIAVSSTELRRELAAGRGWPTLIPRPVVEYIAAAGLYREPDAP